MNLNEKLDILMSQAMDDREGLPSRPAAVPPRIRNAARAGALRPLNIRNVRVGRSGPRASLLRILMTNACSYNCHYCPMRRDRDLPRTLLKPQEMVRIFFDALAREWVSGLFITTGIPSNPVRVMDDLIETLELLRLRHKYQGYIHVKIIPGADDAQVDRITALASRVSVNMETPCGDSLRTIAPEKQLSTTLITLRRARGRVLEARQHESAGKPRDLIRPGGVAGMTTQFVVGATADPDRDIIGKAAELYAAGAMHHVHFSAFRPIRDTPLEEARGAHPLREHRLYQADYLMRHYKFNRSELIFDDSGNLPLIHDPKVAWAIAHPEYFPVEVQTASYHQLLRVPGVGPGAAKRIVENRRTTLTRNTGDLRAMGVVTTRAAGFLMLRGRRLGAERWLEQLSLWTPEAEAEMNHTLHEFSPGTFR